MAKVSEVNPATFFTAIAKSLMRNAEANAYRYGNKVYAFLGFSVSPLDWGWVSIVEAGPRILFDLSDYLAVTPEGYVDDYITMHIQLVGAFLSVGSVPWVDTGGLLRSFGGPVGLEPDREFPAEVNLLSFSVGPVSLSSVSFDSDGTVQHLADGSWGLSFSEWQLGASASLFEVKSPSVSLEFKRSILDLSQRNAFGAWAGMRLEPSQVRSLGETLKPHLFHWSERIKVGPVSIPKPLFRFRVPRDATDWSR
jgi:hypothetical protein